MRHQQLHCVLVALGQTEKLFLHSLRGSDFPFQTVKIGQSSQLPERVAGCLLLADTGDMHAAFLMLTALQLEGAQVVADVTVNASPIQS